MTELKIDVPGLTKLVHDNGVWTGWLWISEVDHPEVVDIHLAMGAHRVPLGGEATMHLPIDEIQVHCFRDESGRQGFDMVAIHNGVVPQMDDDEEPIEIMVRDFLLARFAEATSDSKD